MFEKDLIDRLRFTNSFDFIDIKKITISKLATLNVEVIVNFKF